MVAGIEANDYTGIETVNFEKYACVFAGRFWGIWNTPWVNVNAEYTWSLKQEEITFTGF